MVLSGGGGRMYRFEIVTESELLSERHRLDEHEAVEEAERKNCIVAYYE